MNFGTAQIIRAELAAHLEYAETQPFVYYQTPLVRKPQ